MSFPERYAVTVDVDASGDGTGYTANVRGEIVSIQYVKDDYANGVDVVVTGEATGLAVWTGTNVDASVTVYPVAGAVVLAGTTSSLTERPVCVVNERLKFVVAAGGVSTSGTFHVIVR